MHLKRVTNKYRGETRVYAQIVQSVRREDGQVTQDVMKSLGRAKSEEEWNRAESIPETMRKAEKLVRLKELEIKHQLELGGIWVGDEIWREVGVGAALASSFSERKTGFDLERIVFLLVVNRLYKPSSDWSALRWINEKAYTQMRAKKQWIYRSLDVLVEGKDRIENSLFENLKESLDLSLDLVLYDLTSSYFEGVGPKLAMYGYSRDHRPDRKQLVLGVVMADGIPIAHRVWAGNTADKSTLKEVVADLRERFGIRKGKVVLVADRGVVSLPNLGELEEIGYDYVFSTRRRRDRLVEGLLVKDVSGSGRLRAEEVHSTGGRRYILCLDEETREARLKTLRHVREEAGEKLHALRERYKKSGSGKSRGRPMTRKSARQRVDKILGTSKRLFDVTVDATVKWELNEEAWRYERAIAGKFLLVTTSDLEPLQAMESYKDLKDVEQAFDELKNLLKLRPIYHRVDKRVKGHVFICILALLLKRLMEKKTGLMFREIMKKLERLKVNVIEVEGEEIYQRNQINHGQKEILKELAVEKPPKILTEPKM